MTKKQRKDVYERTTERIVALLEEGTVPWHRPWKTMGIMPCNANSKRPYRGWNLLATLISGYSSPYWATVKGWNKLGGKVKKGEKGTLVVGWKSVERVIQEVDEATGETKESTRRSLTGFAYTVFNEEQVEGATIKGDKRPELADHEPVEAAQALIENWTAGAGCSIQHGGDRAYYAPLTDSIGLPLMGRFDSPEAYYRTALHEMTHATGASHRLDRFKPEEGQFTFESESYSKEELVAELGASFLSAMVGIDSEPEVKNSANYIANWLKKLKEDKKLIISAASKAQLASDYILGDLPHTAEPEVAQVA